MGPHVNRRGHQPELTPPEGAGVHEVVRYFGRCWPPTHDRLAGSRFYAAFLRELDRAPVDASVDLHWLESLRDSLGRAHREATQER